MYAAGLLGLGQVSQHLPPDRRVAAAEPVPVAYDAVAVKGYLGGLDGYAQVLQDSGVGGIGDRPGMALALAVIFQGFQAFNALGKGANGVKVHGRGVFGIDVFQPPQLGGADPSSGGKEKQESRPPGGNQFGR